MLRNHWDVVTMDSVPGAIAKMGEGGISAVLTDWNMPYGGGAVVCREAAQLGLPTVCWSGGGFQPGMESAGKFIHKPSPLEVIDKALWDAIQSG